MYINCISVKILIESATEIANFFIFFIFIRLVILLLSIPLIILLVILLLHLRLLLLVIVLLILLLLLLLILLFLWWLSRTTARLIGFGSLSTGCSFWIYVCLYYLLLLGGLLLSTTAAINFCNSLLNLINLSLSQAFKMISHGATKISVEFYHTPLSRLANIL